MNIHTDNLAIVHSYLKAVESGATGAALAAFYAPEAIQEEFPNRLVTKGAQRDVSAILEAAIRGQKVLTGQRFEVKHSYVCGDSVILELLWTGTLAVALGNTPVGGEMRAHFACFFDFEDGKILAQRNYDCFEDW